MNRVLLLNNECEPLHITSWKRAIVLLIKGKAEYVEKLEEVEDFIQIDDSYIPKTIKLTYDVAVPELELPFSRENVFFRDEYTCQYCGRKFPSNELTLDHVFPKSRFGPDIWENIATCCKECNQKKADRTPKEAGMKLLKRPDRPKDYKLFELSKYNAADRECWEKFYKKVS